MYDALDRSLVHALQMNARAPFSRIAAALGVSDQTVARRYARLRGAGSLRVLGLTSSEALGEVRWLVRVQCTPDSAGAVAEALARREDTTWVTLNSGGAEVNCITRTSPDSADHTLLLQRLPRTRSVVSVTAHCMLHVFFGGPQSLAFKSGALTPAQLGALTPDVPAADIPDPDLADPRLPAPGSAAITPALDDADRRLLAVLAVDGRAGLAELAAAAGRSQSTVRRRMDELLAAGVLYFDVDCDWRIFGVRTRTVLWLSVAPARLAETGRALAAHPEVGFVCATTGPTNLYAVVMSPDVRAVYTYLTTRVATLPSVDRVESAPIMRILKGPSPLAPLLPRPS